MLWWNFGIGGGTVTNCLVKEISTTNAKRKVGVGPADFPLHPHSYREVTSWEYLNLFGHSTIKNCVIQEFSSIALSGKFPSWYDDGEYDEVWYSELSYTAENNQLNSGPPQVSSHSSLGGEYGTIWYYGGTTYNNGYPYLRQFINWKTIKFKAGQNGSVDQTSITIPAGVDHTQIINTNNKNLVILNQPVNAEPNEGCLFTEWRSNSDNTEYTAIFDLQKLQLKFNAVSGVEAGDNKIYPSIKTSLIVYYGTKITSTYDSDTGELKYTFKSTTKDETVTYRLPEKYELSDVNNPGTVTSYNTQITPVVSVKTFDITFLTVSGSGNEGEVWEDVKYGQSIDCGWPSSEYLDFETNGQNTIVYEASEGWRCDYVRITIANKEDSVSCYSEEEVDKLLQTVTCDITIRPYYLRWYTVNFAPAKDPDNNTDKASITSSVTSLVVKHGQSISVKLSSDRKTLTYEYGNESVVYKAISCWILRDQLNRTSIKISADGITITPVAEFYACIVRMFNESKDAYDGNKAMATMSVSGDTYGTSADGIFAVEYDTSVSVTIQSSTKYIYTFTSGQVVTYTTTAVKYEIDSYGLNGTSKSFTFSEDITNKDIKPTFRVKTRNLKVSIIKDGSTETTKYTAYYSSKITYSANLSLNNDSHFTYSYSSLYNSIPNSEIKYSGYFVESYIIKNGETSSTKNVDGTIVANTEITVINDIEIAINFTKFYTVTFATGQTGISSSATLNTYSNPMNLRTGWKIEGTYSGYPSRELKYKVIKADGSGVGEVFKYILAQYYRVTNTNNVESLQEDTTISPTLQFYACEVTMGSIGSSMGTINVTGDSYGEENDGNFVVEFNTNVEFKKETITPGLFKYTYTFSSGQVIIYTMRCDKYSMQYDLNETTGERERICNGLNGEDGYTFEEGRTNVGISPEFGFKQYAGELG